MTINKYEITIRDRDFILVDTPGFDDTYLGYSDVLKMLVKWLESTYRAGTKLSGIMYLHRITDARMQGSALRNLKMFKQLCGEGYFKNLTLGTTCWSLVDPQEATSREMELEENNNFWKPMISRGARMVRIPDDVTEARNLVYKITNHKATALQIQREVVDQKTNFDNLSATKALNSELEKLRKKHEAEKKRLAEENRRRLERVAREQREQQRRRAAIEARNRRIESYLENTRNCEEKKPFGKCDRCKSSLDKWKVNWRKSLSLPSVGNNLPYSC